MYNSFKVMEVFYWEILKQIRMTVSLLDNVLLRVRTLPSEHCLFLYSAFYMYNNSFAMIKSV